MELTPKVFRDVQFREKLRGGYHPEDVDEFLEQAALGTQDLLEKLRLANERADRAEQLAADASSADDALKRVLVLAQRTADQAVKEAYDEAERVVSDARRKADAILVEAEQQGRASHEAALSQRRTALEVADASLRQTQEQVEALREWVDVHRNHLLGVMRDAEAVIEGAGLVSPPPEVAPASPERGGDQAPRPDDASWDPHYLDNLEAQATGEHMRPAAEAQAPPTSEEGADAPTDNWQAMHSQSENGEASSAAEGGPHQPGNQASADRTMAIDERALDNFFSDQDLGHDRGLGRFRRRQ